MWCLFCLQIQDAKREAMEANDEAQNAHDAAVRANNETMKTQKKLETISTTLVDFIKGKDSARPENIRKVSIVLLTRCYIPYLLNIDTQKHIDMNSDKHRPIYAHRYTDTYTH